MVIRRHRSESARRPLFPTEQWKHSKRREISGLDRPVRLGSAAQDVGSLRPPRDLRAGLARFPGPPQAEVKELAPAMQERCSETAIVHPANDGACVVDVVGGAVQLPGGKLGQVPPRRREGVFLCNPFRMIVVPITHDLIHVTTVDTARLPLSLLDEVAEERGLGANAIWST